MTGAGPSPELTRGGLCLSESLALLMGRPLARAVASGSLS